MTPDSHSPELTKVQLKEIQFNDTITLKYDQSEDFYFTPEGHEVDKLDFHFEKCYKPGLNGKGPNMDAEVVLVITGVKEQGIQNTRCNFVLGRLNHGLSFDENRATATVSVGSEYHKGQDITAQVEQDSIKVRLEHPQVLLAYDCHAVNANHDVFFEVRIPIKQA